MNRTEQLIRLSTGIILLAALTLAGLRLIILAF